MRQIEPRVPILEVEGLLFHIVELKNSIRDGPAGIFINKGYLKETCILRTVTRNNATFRFVPIDPIPDISRTEVVASVHLYAEWTADVDDTSSLFESAIDTGLETPQVTAIVHQLLSDGFECACEFVNILRRKFLQYWLAYPTDTVAQWYGVEYYSKKREKWYSMLAGDDFSSTLIDSELNDNSQMRWRDLIIKKIDASDISEMSVAQPEAPYSFAEEMISTSLVELSKDRKRSAIMHSVIALEASAKRGLNYLLTERLKGLEQGSIIEAISREVSVVTLARIVHYHVVGKTYTTLIDWTKIKKLHNTRNTILHKEQRRLPNYEIIKESMLEIFKCVHTIENALREKKNKIGRAWGQT